MKVKTHRIGDLCRMVKGTSPTLKTEPGPYPLVVTAGYRRTADSWQLEGPAVCIPLVSSTGHGDAALHRIHYQEGKFALANLLVALLPNDPSVCDAKYLYHLLMTQKDELLVPLMQGTANVSLKEQDIAGVEIPLPLLAEQQRVVARIEELAAPILEACTLRHQAGDEVDALLASASATLFEPKAGWRIMSVGDFCEPPQYGYTESATRDPVGPRFLRITDIQDGSVNWEKVPYCRCPEPAKYLLKPNDLVFARTGATTGKSFVIRECPEAVFASYLIRLRVRDTVSVDYLYRYFQSPSYWEQIADEKKGTGQPNLNGSKLDKLRVPVAPLPEQRRIVAELGALEAQVDALKRLQAETAGELDALMPSVFDTAFNEEL